MEAQPRPVFLTTSRISLQKPVFTLVPVTSKEDMSEYGLFPPIIKIFRYVKCKFKVSRTVYSICCCACQLLIFNLLLIKFYISLKHSNLLLDEDKGKTQIDLLITVHFLSFTDHEICFNYLNYY